MLHHDSFLPVSAALLTDFPRVCMPACVVAQIKDEQQSVRRAYAASMGTAAMTTHAADDDDE